MKVPELLAPAGSQESLIAAIDAGADAVYLGGSRFGARSYAENFDEDSITAAVQYAHLRGVKVYVTVNTLVRDRELPDTARFILFLYSAGVDAILVQDLGVASIAREIAPGLPLHASTQMTIYNQEGVAWARERGFSRVVLARELSLEEISEIAAAPECQGIGLEIFVHGALCYSYSGQCLFSSMIGGRSGNRGMCAQPCRKPYTFVNGQPDVYGRPVSLSKTNLGEKYLLSTKDLCSYRDLETIVSAPVESLKIEGRMRSPRYVSTVVSIYRRAIDAISAGEWSPEDQDEELLALAFNRGFTRGYISGVRHHEIMGRGHPDHRGVMIGTVLSYHPRTHLARVRPAGKTLPCKGDGVVFIDPSTGRENGMVLYGTPAKDGDNLQVPVSHEVRPGDILYLTRRKDGGTLIKHGISGQPGKQLPIPLDLVITWDEERRPVIRGEMPGKDGARVIHTHTGSPMEVANKIPLTSDQIASQICKTGGTQFIVRNLTLHYPGNLFTPVSVLNQLRRDFLHGAELAIASSWRPAITGVSYASEKTRSFLSSYEAGVDSGPGRDSIPMRISVYANSAEVAHEALKCGCDMVYFEPQASLRTCRCDRKEPLPPGCRQFQEISDKVSDLLALFPGDSRKIFWKMPLIPGRDFIDMLLGSLPGMVEKGIGGIMVDSPGLATKIRRQVPGLKICGGAGLNIFNHISAGALPEFFTLTLSPELSLDDISNFTAWFNHHRTPAFEVIAQGNLEVLNSIDCIPTGIPGRECPCSGLTGNHFLGLQDSTGRIFPFNVDPWCHTIIRNSSETCLIDSIPALKGAGISSVAIDARHKTPDYIREMIMLYREAIRRSEEYLGREQFSDLLSSVKKLSLGGITSASFRGNLL